MRLDPDAVVYGVHAKILVECAEHLHERERGFTFECFCMLLGAPAQESKAVLEQLMAEGYIQQGTEPDLPYAPTNKLGQLALATVGKGITRAKADKLLKAILAKAQEINADPAAHGKCTVTCIAVFGSYLGTAPVLGDLDVAVEVDRPPPTPEEASKLARMMGTGRTWPEQKVLLALRMRRPTQISIHSVSEVLDLDTPYKVVLGEIPAELLKRHATRTATEATEPTSEKP
jgi:predicted nucleotidyltransferase